MSYKKHFWKKYPKTFIFSIIIIALGIKWLFTSNEKPEKLLLDRIWVDKLPKLPSEQFHLFTWTSKKIGIYQYRTFFKGDFEIFFFHHNSNTISFFFPHSKKRFKTEYTIKENCIAPPPFTLCLTLKESPIGPTTYYGMKEKSEMDKYFPQLTPFYLGDIKMD